MWSRNLTPELSPLIASAEYLPSVSVEHTSRQEERARQILSGTRAILYFGAAGNAGLTRGIIAAAAGLIFWLALGATVVRWYDRKGLHRIRPDLLAYIQQSIGAYRAQAKPQPQPAEPTAQPRGG